MRYLKIGQSEKIGECNNTVNTILRYKYFTLFIFTTFSIKYITIHLYFKNRNMLM